MVPIKFRLNQTYGFVGDVVRRTSRWPPWWPSWTLEWNYFSNSESLCHSDTSRQVSAKSDLKFGRRCCLKNFKLATMVAFLDIGTIFAILNFYVAPMPPIKFWLNLTYSFGGDVVWRISIWPPWCPSWISEWNNFSNSESLCHVDTTHQISAQSDLQFGSCRLNNFKMATMAAILDIGTEWFYQFWISMLPQCLLLSFSSIQLMVLEEMSKMWKANNGQQTDDERQAMA